MHLGLVLESQRLGHTQICLDSDFWYRASTCSKLLSLPAAQLCEAGLQAAVAHLEKTMQSLTESPFPPYSLEST